MPLNDNGAVGNSSPAGSLNEAARFARRVVTSRRRRYQVPHFRLDPVRRTASATVWMICPDWDKPAGGTRTQYRAVDALNDAGVAAAIVHRRAGFACTWFAHTTRVISGAEVAIGERDVLVIPEVYGPSILD